MRIKRKEVRRRTVVQNCQKEPGIIRTRAGTIRIGFNSTHHISLLVPRGREVPRKIFHCYRHQVCRQCFDFLDPLRSLYILIHVTRSKHIIQALRIISILHCNSVQLNSIDNDAILWSCSSTRSPQRPTQRPALTRLHHRPQYIGRTSMSTRSWSYHPTITPLQSAQVYGVQILYYWHCLLVHIHISYYY